MAWDWWRSMVGTRAHPKATGERERWVMVDVETSGLDARHDRLLAIAAVGLHVDWAQGRLVMRAGDSFEVVVRQDAASSRDNILLHGIGLQRQRDGVPAAEALAAFQGFVGTAPLLAFHAAFDQTLIGRHARLANDWLDVEHLCAVTHPQVRARALDEWMAHFGIHCAVRHQAAADTWAECELLLRIWPRIARECASWRDVQRLAASHRWLPRGS